MPYIFSHFFLLCFYSSISCEVRKVTSSCSGAIQTQANFKHPAPRRANLKTVIPCAHLLEHLLENRGREHTVDVQSDTATLIHCLCSQTGNGNRMGWRVERKAWRILSHIAETANILSWQKCLHIFLKQHALQLLEPLLLTDLQFLGQRFK